MTNRSQDRRIGIAAFTMTLLRRGDRYLMLHRSKEKAFAPGLWTGIGGRVEPDEFDDIYAAALREIIEETGIPSAAVGSLILRRTLIQQRPGFPVTILLYFTAETDHTDLGPCAEGTLHWLTTEEIGSVDVIENTALVLPYLIESLARDPEGRDALITGAVSFSASNELQSLIWSS